MSATLSGFAFIGGPGTVRGYPWQRFRGDAAVSGSAEVRMRLARVNLLVLRPVVGVFALADAGRVWYDGESEGGWHTAVGGGLYYQANDGAGLKQARELAKTSANIVVYKMGEKGAITFHGTQSFETGIFPVTALKPTGAGDAFMASSTTRFPRSPMACTHS